MEEGFRRSTAAVSPSLSFSLSLSLSLSLFLSAGLSVCLSVSVYLSDAALGIASLGLARLCSEVFCTNSAVTELSARTRLHEID